VIDGGDGAWSLFLTIFGLTLKYLGIASNFDTRKYYVILFKRTGLLRRCECRREEKTETYCRKAEF
jgi:hypothetical protein